jgi:hypothetical protein
VRTEHLVNRDELVDVADPGRRSVGTDVAHVGGGNACVCKSDAHRALGAFSLRGGLRQVIGVCRRAVADELGVDLRAALDRRVALFE